MKEKGHSEEKTKREIERRQREKMPPNREALCVLAVILPSMLCNPRIHEVKQVIYL